MLIARVSTSLVSELLLSYLRNRNAGGHRPCKENMRLKLNCGLAITLCLVAGRCPGVGGVAGAGSEIITQGDQVRVPSEALLDFARQQNVSIPVRHN